MLEAREVTRTAARPIARLRLTVPREAIRTVMGPGLDELRAALAAQGVRPTGPWFTHHLRMDPNLFDFEIGLPVPGPVAPSNRVTAGEWPAMTAARAVYHGPYEGLPSAWAEFDAWVSAQGHSPAPDLWECYRVGPESGPDPASWRTELTRPLTD